MDSLRAIAALSIVVHHASSTPPAAIQPYVFRLNVGVQIFFVISAFLLYRPFVVARLQGTKRPAAGPYAWRRVLRIVPAYWVALTIAGIVTANRALFGSDGFIFYGFAQVYDPVNVLRGIPVAWSLCVEVVLYAFLPLWAWSMRRAPVRRTPRARLRAEIAGVAALFAAGIAFKVLFYWGDSPTQAGGLLLTSSFLAFLDMFALGMGLAVASAWYANRREPAPLRFLGRNPGIAWGAALIAFWASATQLGLPTNPWARVEPWAHLAYSQLYAVVAVGLVIPGIFGDPARGTVRRILAWRPLVWMGVVSYGVYLWHPLVLRMLKQWGIVSDVSTALRVSTFLGAIILAVPCTLVIAWLSWNLVERPALRLKDLRLREAAPRTQARAGLAGPGILGAVLVAIGLLGTGYVFVDAVLAIMGLLVISLLLPHSRAIVGRLPASRTALAATAGAIGATLALVPLLVPPDANAQSAGAALPPGTAEAKGLPPRAYVAATYDGSHITLYVNGEQVGRTAHTGSTDRGAAVTELGSFLGRDGWSGGLDDVALYAEALPAATLLERYQMGTTRGAAYAKTVQLTPGVAAYWRLSEPGPVMHDSVGHAHGRSRESGVVEGQPSLITGDPDGSIALDGASGAVRIRDVPSLRWSFTLEAWVTSGKQVANRTIAARPGAWFLKTDVLGRWTAGVWTDGKIAAVSSTHPIQQRSTPERGRAPAKALTAKGNTTPGVAILALIAALGLAAAAVPGLRRRRGRDDDGDAAPDELQDSPPSRGDDDPGAVVVAPDGADEPDADKPLRGRAADDEPVRARTAGDESAPAPDPTADDDDQVDPVFDDEKEPVW
jgi:peptidoglycan/LPS O-acetylase OafA/YrhL